jgi:hypothetical protein
MPLGDCECGESRGNFQVRWFVIHPQPDSASKPPSGASMRERFADFYGAGYIIDQTLHPGMHETHSIDIICLLQGEASLILESGETRLQPGNVVIQLGPTTPGRHMEPPPYSSPF